MTEVRVRYADAEPNGLATMVGGLIEANLAHHPQRVALLRPAVVELVARDADVGVRLRIDRREVEVSNAPSDGRADLRVVGDSLSLVELASTPLRLGLPDLLHPEGRVVIRKVVSGDLRIEGLLRHPLALSRLSRLLSVA